ncbi:transposase [Pararhodospirillum oryzae]|uniref:Transposase zinc-ribbon domain-containing protein n=1 Tax=Pararhodospirillum oryzae TaxID=478448 RepID=A0A512H3I5_9PROT|nr:transposase [Pararhodospirillum oryzae]GEO80001.1 hypothetical protein ROR02_01320 [Pararhodospirillum oryzae]
MTLPSSDPAPLTRETLLSDAQAAQALLETLRWPRGRPLCPHCGFRHSYRLAGPGSPGVRFKCARCRKQYSVRRGTVLERSNVSEGRWLLALWLAVTAPGADLARRIHRATGVSPKTAWAMAGRIAAHPDDPVLVGLRREFERATPLVAGLGWEGGAVPVSMSSKSVSLGRLEMHP